MYVYVYVFACKIKLRRAIFIQSPLVRSVHCHVDAIYRIHKCAHRGKLAKLRLINLKNYRIHFTNRDKARERCVAIKSDLRRHRYDGEINNYA
jgi:hypothetical protein